MTSTLALTGVLGSLRAVAPGHEIGFGILPWLVLVPLVGAAVIAVLPGNRPENLRLMAIVFSIISGALAIYVLVEFRTGVDGFQMVTNRSWIGDLGIGWHFGVDGISLLLVVLSGILFPIAIVAVAPDHDPKPYYAWMLLLMAGSMGTFVALDLVLFFICFEIVLVPMYFLIAMWGHGNRRYAANKFFLYTMFGSAFMMVAILGTAILHQHSSGGPLTFDLVEIATDQSIPTAAARWLFLGFAMAFAVKVPMFPVHTWLPDAHTEAPTAGSVILAGILLKMGAYGFIRFGLYLFPEAAHAFAPLLLTLGVAGILYGAVAAAMQKDLKRIIAYSSVAHLGFIIVGIFALNVEGLEGGVIQMINHGVSTPALFLLVGMIYTRCRTREIARLGGLQTPAPVLAGIFTLVMFSSIGLPGLNGFVGEFLSLLGAFRSARWWSVMGAAGVILAALYLLWAYQRVFHGRPSTENARIPDLSFHDIAVMVPLIALIIFCGVYPKAMLDRVEPSVKALVVHMGRQVPSLETKDVPLPARREASSDNAEAGR